MLDWVMQRTCLEWMVFICMVNLWTIAVYAYDVRKLLRQNIKLEGRRGMAAAETLAQL